MFRCWPLPIRSPYIFCVLLTIWNFGITQTIQLLESPLLELDGPSSVFSDLDSAFCINSNCTHPQQRCYVISIKISNHIIVSVNFTKLLFTGPSFNNPALTQYNFLFKSWYNLMCFSEGHGGDSKEHSFCLGKGVWQCWWLSWRSSESVPGWFQSISKWRVSGARWRLEPLLERIR